MAVGATRTRHGWGAGQGGNSGPGAEPRRRIRHDDGCRGKTGEDAWNLNEFNTFPRDGRRPPGDFAKQEGAGNASARSPIVTTPSHFSGGLLNGH